MARPITAAATFCATLVDEWVHAGVTRAFIAPGSRSTPLALALHDREEIAVALFHDERSASFAALGHGLATHTPGIVLCSSGTAGTHFHAAVVEADLSAVPLIVCTADRPPELVGVGAPQTIVQTNLYGPIVRLFVEPGVPDPADLAEWRPFGARTVAAAIGARGKPGPVHCNLAFRDPLDGAPDELPIRTSNSIPWKPEPKSPTAAYLARIVDILNGRHGVVVAGSGITDPEAVIELAKRLQWPLIADQRSGCASADDAVVFGDLIARTARFTVAQRPEVILRFGEQQSSKALNQWITHSGATIIAATPNGRWIDPDRAASLILSEEGLATALLEADFTTVPGRTTEWTTANDAASAAVAQFAEHHPASEIAVARSILLSSPATANVVLSSSMPIRQVEWFAGDSGERRVFSNRGANGIDGVIATAAGVAYAAGPTICFIGDVALLHDASSLAALSRRPIDLTIVVVDNDGGGIFSHLPQSSNLTTAQFEFLFGTPHGTDIATLAAAHGIQVEPWSPEALSSIDGVRMLIASSDRARSLAEQAELVAMTTAAIEATLE